MDTRSRPITVPASRTPTGVQASTAQVRRDEPVHLLAAFVRATGVWRARGAS